MTGERVEFGQWTQDGLESKAIGLCESFRVGGRIQLATVRGEGGGAVTGSDERRLVRKYARTR
ncbi:hypothetical protein SNOD_00005 [Streptomyces nodosus]|uniref:Uncharacterized protein n=1 Tax=Streptomyces nodosus TaxID=40318 RepID=A0A0B5D6K4_9ACTN|nr:hypothetical protein SNOD_00005 [Streptomyces nodosus]